MSSMRLLLATLGVALLPALAHADLPHAGTWRLVGSATAARDAAVERATEDMSVFTRGIARRRLRAGTPVHQRVVIEEKPGGVRVALGEAYDVTARLGGPAVATRDAWDNALQATHRRSGRRLVQRLVGEDATVTHTLQLSEDGATLTLTVRIESHHLPGDVVYRARYRR